MRYLVTGEQMKEIDGYTIGTVGIPSLVLMERAAMAVAREAEKLAGKADSIWAVCGTGNNGADGVAAARMLALKGYSVTVILAGSEERGTREFHTQLEIARKLGLSIAEWKDFIPGRCGLVIDGIFGVGLSREVEGEYREILEKISSMEVPVVAVDIPSGIHSTTGQVMGAAVKAAVTVTFGWEKLGSVLYPGREYCGRVVIEDIGFPPVSFQKAGPSAWTYEKEDLSGLPLRSPGGNKGTFGKVLLIAGSKGMSGAACLAALAAYRMGAGMVKIMTVEDNRTILQQLLPEAMVTSYEPEEVTGSESDAGFPDDSEKSCCAAWERRMERECAWADVIVAGPGLGQEPHVRFLIRSLLTSVYVPVVLDADALNTMARYPELEQYYTENIIITPHLGEMSRLTGRSVEEIQKRVADTATEYGSRHGIVCVLKDAATVVAGRDGQCYVNTSGNSCMAKAGSGDVLAGTIAGLLAQKMEPFDAAALGVYVHGLAGDRYRAKHGPAGMLARELAEELENITKEGDRR